MNNYLLVAGILAVILGATHSILGEWLVFRRLRAKDSFAWITNNSALPLRSIRILWASWHLVTIFGWGFGAILFKLSADTSHSAATFTVTSIAISMLVSATIVLIGTKGKHPGWIVLSVIGVLTWFS